jgi:hypothetical protein
MYFRVGLLLISILLGAGSLSAQSTPSQSKKEFPFQVHGFLLGNYTARTQDADGKVGGPFLWGDERLRLEISNKTSKGCLGFQLKGDLFHDAVGDKPGGLVREAYFDCSRGPFDLRLGRQIVTWGLGDLLFINDVFPKDWGAFFSGRPLEYLKLGVDAAKLDISTHALNAELVVIPFFKPDNLPPPDRFFFYDPFAGVQDRPVQKPASTWGNAEFALRVYRRVADTDISLYAYRGYWRQPSFRPDRLPQPTELIGFYPRLNTYGASAQRNVGAGLFSFEAGYYDSQDDRRGMDPAIPNSEWRFLVGYQRQFANDFTVGTQYYNETMRNYVSYKATLPTGLPLQDHIRHLVTLRLTKFLKYQTWKLSMFGFYGLSDQDGMFIPEVWRAFTDRLSLSVGANIFMGQRPTTFFGQFRHDNNVYAAIRYGF